MHLNALSDILTMDLKAGLFSKITNKQATSVEAQEYLVYVSVILYSSLERLDCYQYINGDFFFRACRRGLYT